VAALSKRHAKIIKKKGLAVKNRCHDFITIQFPIQNEW
jgi:hypothetical protein